MNSEEKKAYELIEEICEENDDFILAQQYIDGTYWFIAIGKDELGTDTVHFPEKLYTVTPSNDYEIDMEIYPVYLDAKKNAKNYRNVKLGTVDLKNKKWIRAE